MVWSIAIPTPGHRIRVGHRLQSRMSLKDMWEALVPSEDDKYALDRLDSSYWKATCEGMLSLGLDHRFYHGGLPIHVPNARGRGPRGLLDQSGNAKAQHPFPPRILPIFF